jgi:hypothetical protein
MQELRCRRQSQQSCLAAKNPGHKKNPRQVALPGIVV